MLVIPLQEQYLYQDARLPFGVTVDQIVQAVNDFYAMFADINAHIIGRGYGRLETLLREATFSDVVGESLTRAVAKSCPSLKRNRWPNGYPDLLSRADNREDRQLRGVGIEVKASRARGQWQAHNREAGWFLVFRFVADTITEGSAQAAPFQIVEILAAELTLQDWSVSRGAEGDQQAETSSELPVQQALQEATADTPLEEVVSSLSDVIEVKRRTRTTSTNASGTRKLRSNPIYANPDFVVKHKDNPLWIRIRN